MTVKEAKKIEAIEFAEWIRTFEVLERENGFWVIESQVSSEELYSAYLEDKERFERNNNQNKKLCLVKKNF
jgi:hypothetical protein